MRYGKDVLRSDYNNVMLLLSQIENLDDYQWVDVIRYRDGSTGISLTGRKFSKQLYLENGKIVSDVYAERASSYTLPLYMLIEYIEKPVYPDFIFFK